MTPPTIDWGGLALFVGSITALLTFVGGFIMQVLVFRRQGRMDATLKNTHDLVNGLAERKDSAIKEAGVARGVAMGKAEGEAKAAVATELAKSALDKIPAAKPEKK